MVRGLAAAVMRSRAVAEALQSAQTVPFGVYIQS
jgi:hypothetical protein